MIYRLSEEEVNNIVYFLNKVSFKGLKEVEAATRIIHALKNPTNELEDSE